eukprot:Rmarinus@m.17852
MFHPDCVCEVVHHLLCHVTSPSTLTAEKLIHYGLQNDPFQKPLRQWIRALMSITGEREIILSVALLFRALGISWEIPLRDVEPSEFLIPYNRHRVILVALILTDKYYTDDPYKISSWARRFPYWSTRTLYAMEIMFLSKLEWRVGMSPEEFNRFLRFASSVVPLLRRQRAVAHAPPTVKPGAAPEPTRTEAAEPTTTTGPADYVAVGGGDCDDDEYDVVFSDNDNDSGGPVRGVDDQPRDPREVSRPGSLVSSPARSPEQVPEQNLTVSPLSPAAETVLQIKSRSATPATRRRPHSV